MIIIITCGKIAVRTLDRRRESYRYWKRERDRHWKWRRDDVGARVNPGLESGGGPGIFIPDIDNAVKVKLRDRLRQSGGGSSRSDDVQKADERGLI
ncbi:hypothetical protein EVAR_11484_1 [Eumeta japonica]|uniref:Uncharacterized protein n=1 Tax=Eumeta variegata TaxID=151549 RepID=A0A4C1TYK9_EUMVA|nr:hypothetical protein EVAR_11484_1 [Eumeta japonica]